MILVDFFKIWRATRWWKVACKKMDYKQPRWWVAKRPWFPDFRLWFYEFRVPKLVSKRYRVKRGIARNRGRKKSGVITIRSHFDKALEYVKLHRKLRKRKKKKQKSVRKGVGNEKHETTTYTELGWCGARKNVFDLVAV